MNEHLILPGLRSFRPFQQPPNMCAREENSVVNHIVSPSFMDAFCGKSPSSGAQTERRGQVQSTGIRKGRRGRLNQCRY